MATRWELSAVRRAFTTTEAQVLGGLRCEVARQAQTSGG